MPDDTGIWNQLRRSKHLTLIAGPCVIENEAVCLRVATVLRKTCRNLGINYIFKASYDKANRSSGASFRGPGLNSGLEVLARVRAKLQIPVLTDVHTEEQVLAAAEVVDVLQIPAFLCRQTDLILAAVRTGKIVNLKKGQFLSPQEMGQVVRKATGGGGRKLLVTERGTTFGYNNLVADMRSIPIMREFGFPVILTRPIPFNCPAQAETARAGSVNWRRCWPVAPSPPAPTAFSLKHTLIPIAP